VAQNRSLANVVLGGYGIPAPTAAATGPVEKLVHVETDFEHVADLLVNAKSVVIAPGYGLAGARLRRFTQPCARRGAAQWLRCDACLRGREFCSSRRPHTLLATTQSRARSTPWRTWWRACASMA
jgi:hypothetical protein